MAVTDDFSASELDLNGFVNITSPTALVWGPDGRLYVTQQQGNIFVLTVEFGDKDPNDGDATNSFYVTAAETIDDVQDVPNHNDDGTDSGSSVRQVTGIDVTLQFDSNGDPVIIDGEQAVVMYVTSSDNRIGAGTSGNDAGLDTNSGVITRLTQTESGWDAVDIVRGLARSEENHATNGLEVIQEINETTGELISERLIVANGGNANTGAPSNNFAGQQEQPYSAAILEIDLDEINGLPVLNDGGRAYVYDLPTLDDPTRAGSDDNNDPFGGNDGLNSAKLLADGPVQIYSAGYRNAYDIEVTDDGRVFTYDNGANNNWGGRPAGEDEDGDTDSVEAESGTPNGYIATNLFVEDNSEIDGNFNPQNWDQLHEVTRSDDLNGRSLSAGEGGATTYQWDHPDLGELTLVYGGHPNPTRAEGARAGLLYTPEGGVGNAKLMVSNVEKAGGSSDFLEVVAWFDTIGYSQEFINETVVAVDPGVRYSETFVAGFGVDTPTGRPTTTGVFSLVEDTNGPIGLPSDINEIVSALNPVEGNYLEAGFTDGSLDTGKGSVNGLTEYTSSIFDDDGQADMQGALIAASLNQTQYYIIGRDENGVVQTSTTTSGNSGQAGSTPRSVAAEKDFLASGGAPLGLAAIGDDLIPHGGDTAFRGSIWGAIYKQNGPVIEIFQPGNADTNALLGVNNYAGEEPSDDTDNDLDGVDHLNDPFEFDADNGLNLAAGQTIALTFDQVGLSENPEFSGTLGDTGLMGAAIDGVTPNRDEKSAADGFPAGSQESGLFDNGGNIIPGGNAPILQIKEVQDGTAIGGANTLRDGLHTGVKLDNDVQRLVAEVDIANWWVEQSGGGRVSGLTFGDGTQSNFVRFVFGDVDGNGQLGLEVGLEVGDSYQALGSTTDSALTTALTTGDPAGNSRVQLQLEISDIGGTYALAANYRVKGDATFQSVDLSGATLPAGVLRDVLDGTHTISDGDTTLNSGAAIGIVAEKDDGVLFETVDFDEIRIEGIGNEVTATTEAEAEAPGTSGEDTVIYTGPAADIELHPTVENFDGSGSAADWSVTATNDDNVITAGTGANTVTTGDGEDTVVGSKAGLDGDEITDFSEDDKVVITDATAADAANVVFTAGSAILDINGTTITFTGPDFENFNPADGPELFAFNEGNEGLEVTLVPDETVIYRLNAGGATVAATDDGPDWVTDTDLFNATGPVFRSGATGSTFTQALTNEETEIDYTADVDPAIVPWELFVEERSENDIGGDEMSYNFDVEAGKSYKITLFYTENWNNSFAAVPRIFDVAVEGAVPTAFNDIYPLRDATDFVDGEGEAIPTFANGEQAEKQPYLGVATQREFTFTAQDDLLTLTFQHGASANIQNPKVNAIQITQLGAVGPIEDTTPPVVTDIVVEDSLSDQDSPRLVTVTVADETGFDIATFSGLDGSELAFTGITPAAVSVPQITLNPAQNIATLVYTIDPPAASSAWPTGTFNVAVAAGTFEDEAGNDTEAANFDFTFEAPLQPGDVVLAVNAGGGAVDGADYGLPGVTFEADTFAAPHPTVDFSLSGGGNKANNNGAGQTFTGAALPDTLFTSERWGNEFSYDVDLPNGTYQIDLYFAETYQGVAGGGGAAGGLGDRIFDTEIEGVTVLDDYDLFDDGAGGLSDGTGAPLVKIVKTFEAVVTDGQLNINFDSKVDGDELAADNAKISAFVVRVAEAPGATASLTGDANVAEDAGTASYTVTLSEAPTETTDIVVDITSGTATVPGDAEATGGATQITLTFTPGGALSQDFTVDLADDTLPELDEAFDVAISGLPITFGGSGSVTTTIAANDGPVDSVDGVDVAGGDFSNDGLAPTDLGTLDQGETIVIANQQGDSAPGGRERDYFTFTVAEGQVLSGIILEDWQTDESGTPQAFVGIQQGAQVTVDPTTFDNVTDLLGGHVYNDGDVENAATSQDGDLLSREALGAGSEEGPGGTFLFGDGSGFDAPLPAGTYTMWLNQGGDISTATLRLVTEEFQETVTVELVTGEAVVENGDFGTTEVGFDLTATGLFTGDLTIEYDRLLETGLTQVVSFTDGVGRLTFTVDNDNVDDGPEIINVVELVGGTDENGVFDVLVTSPGEGAVSVVTEDDGLSGGAQKGSLAFAINANGGAFTDESGVAYEASIAGEWVFGGAYTDPAAQQPANGDYTGDGVGNLDDQVYITEYFGGNGTPPLSFTRGSVPAGEYILVLKLAEIFNGATNRVFDITVNGELVADDLNLLADAGLHVASDIEVRVTIPDEGDGTGTLSIVADPSADNAKINGFQLWDAVPLVDPTQPVVSVAAQTFDEEGDTADIVFTRTGPTDEALTLTFAVTDGSAVAGADYVAPTTTTVTFGVGETEATGAVDLIDNDVETATGESEFNVSIVDATVPSGTGVQMLSGTAAITINDDEFVDPTDIDGDGIENTDDPFAYDGSNGADKALTAGNAFRQDFDVDTGNPFSAEAGFSGIMTNPAFSPANTSETDPYGDQTSEATTLVENGVFKTQSSPNDSFAGSGTALNNTIKDNYQSAVDVTGVETFAIEAKANNVFASNFAGGIPTQYASYGITMGAGGVDDFVKFVLGATGGNETNKQLRIEIGDNDSLLGGANTTLASAGIDKATQATIDTVTFRFEVDTTPGLESNGTTPNAGTIVGIATFLDSNGAQIGQITTAPIGISTTGSLAAAIAGNNPLTGGDGGLAYGISITHFNNGANQFTGEWDYLTVEATDALAMSLTAPAAPLAESGDTDLTVVDFGITALGFTGVTDVDYTLNGDPLTATGVVFTDGAATLSIAVPNDDLANGDDTLTVALTGTSNASITVDPTPVDGTITEDDFAPVATPDAVFVNVDTAITVNLAANDTDADNATPELTVTAVGASPVADVDVTLNVDGTVTVTPSNGFIGPVSFSYTVSDPAGNSTVSTAEVTVREAQIFRIQAEDFDSSDTYATQGQAAADGGAVAFLPSGGDTGTATYNLEGVIPPGTYTVLVAYFDENDGVSTIGLDITSDGAAPFSQSFLMDDTTGGNAAQAESLRAKVFADVEVGANGQLVLSGLTGASEYARIDYFEFTLQEDIVDPTNFPAYAPNGINDVVADENVEFSADIGAQFFDDEEDPLTFTAVSDQPGGVLPDGVTFVDGVLSGTPTQSGTFVISVTANDTNSDSAPVDFTFTVNDVNNAPVVAAPVADLFIDQTQSVNIVLDDVFDDQDGDVLTYSLGGPLPDGLTFDAVNGTISGTPTGAPGSTQVTVTATDVEGLMVSDSFVVNVLGAAGGDPIRIEAEDASDLDGFFVASNGSRIQLTKDSSGTATYDLVTVPAGTYQVRIGHWDENDGVSTLSASLLTGAGAQALGQLTLDDDATSSSIAGPESFRLKTLAGTATIEAGDQLQLSGLADDGEFLRIDFIELVPVTATNFAPTAHAEGVEDVAITGLVAIDTNIADAFSDPEEDTLTYGIVDGPIWLGVDAAGNLTGTPTEAGTFAVTVSAEDAGNNPGILATTSFTVTVEVPDNQLPVLDFPVGPLTIDQDNLLEESVTFTDLDGEVVSYDLGEGAPAWLTIDEFGTLSGTPTAADVAADVTVTVIATDNDGGQASVDILVTVVDANDAPEVGTPLEGQTATLGQAFEYILPVDAFTDADIPNGDVLTYSATLVNGDPLPAWLSIDPLTGALSGTPDSATDLAVVITATDAVGEAATAPAFIIDVSAFSVPTDPVQIEAEDFSGIAEATNYAVNNLAAASGDQVIRMPANVTGSVTHDLGEYAGSSYKVAVTFIDETDGVSTGRVFVDGQLLGTWDFDGTAGEQVDPGAATGTFAQPGNFRTIELDPVVGLTADSVLTIEVDSNAGEFGRIDFVTLVPAELPEENAAPTAVTVTPVAPELPEDTDTTAAVKVADITVTDDLLGTNVLSLAGVDADSFEIVGTELFVKAGVVLDFETAPTLDVTVQVDDAEVGEGPFDAATDFSLVIADANDAPLLTVTPLLTEISQDADTTASTPVADIVVTDDALGTFALSLTGDDAALFEIVGDGVTTALTLNLVAGASLDALANAQLDVNVEVDDPEIGDVVAEAVAPVAITVTEGPVTTDTVVLRINAFGDEVAATDGGPNWQADLKDDLGTAPNENNAYLNLESTDAAQDRGDTLAGYTGDVNLIPANVPEAILDSARSSNLPFSYDIPLGDIGGPGEFEVKLYFAELFAGNQTAGSRVFDIQVEGSSPGVLNDFDPSVAGGGDLASISYDVTVENGELNIRFAQDAVNGADNPIINGIEIVRKGDVVTGPTDGQALFTANLGATNVINSSTFTANAMQVTNQSANDVGITRVIIDLADTIIPDTGFDTLTPAQGGPIGDDANKPFAFDAGSLGLSAADVTVTMGDTITDPVSGGNGSNQLILDFAAGSFTPDDILSFSIDIDPFTATSGPIAGAVAGQEIAGGTVTVEFEDGSSATSVITPPDGTIAGRALVQAGQEDLGVPTLTLGDGTIAARVVNQEDLPITVDAGIENANGTARIFILDTAFVSAGGGANPPGNGIQGNNAQAVANVLEVQLDANGMFDGTIPMTRSTTQEGNANGNLGFNYFSVGVVDSNGEVTQTSAPLVVEFDPDANVPPVGGGGGTPAGDAILRINAFGDEIVVADGPDWQADSAANPSPFFTGSQNRGDTDTTPATPNLTDVPNEIFATARSDDGTFSYDIPVADLPGIDIGDTVTVNLYFAEGAGNGTFLRLFDVEMEGALAIDDLNPGEEFAGGGGVISTVVEVVGGTLNIEFLNNNIQNAIVSGIEIVEGGLNPINGGGVINPPADPADALEVLGVDDGNFDGIVQGEAVDDVNNGGNNGSVVLTILDGNNTVDASNFGANSLELTNTGNKEVAAVFIDIRNAVFGDQVFDNDGTGGDTASKPFQIQSDGNTGAFFVGANGVGGNNDDNLFFEGPTPAADTSGQSDNGGNAPISGGYRGLLIRFDGSDGGFGAGETVGFSGDGDSNSLAGFSSGLLNPNNVTSSNFDTGGQSGSELIGSSFTVLFADGTTATGYLGSDTTQAGAAGEAVQGQTNKEAVLTVDTGSGSFDSGQTGTYGGSVPTITVAGTPGDVVRVTLHKGFQPTNEEAGGSPDSVEDVIQGRLDDLVPNFAVNNAFDVQTFDVTIGGNGIATLPANAFDYVDTDSGETFDGDDVQPLALTAAVVLPVSDGSAVSGSGDNDLVPAGPVSQPIYLTNPTQTPVDEVVVEPPVDGYFEIVGSGANQYFKIQIEDGSGGEDPGGKWSFLDAPDGDGAQAGFQGDGYYLFGDEDNTSIDNQNGGDEVLEYNILVPEGSEGTYTFSFRVSRDGEKPNDAQNDLWLNFKHAEEAGNGEIIDFLTGNGSNVAEPDIGGFIKLFGGPNTGAWGTTGNIDGLPDNFTAQLAITEAGLYTVQVDGRSQGFHVDSFELYKGNNPSTNVPDSPFIEGDPGNGGGGEPTGDPIRLQAEDADNLTGNYAVQNLGAADGGQGIGVGGGDGATGGATYDLASAGIGAGTYNVRIVYFDENDGESSLNVNVGDTSQTIIFDDDANSSNIANAQSLQETTLTNVVIDGNDVLSLSAIRDMGEPVRVDYFEFTPIGDTGGGGGGGGGGEPGTLVVAVDASSDDFETSGGAGSSDLEFGLNGTTPQSIGIRFDDIDIPAGATITDAFLRFEAFESSSGAANFTIEVENNASPATYSSGNGPNDRSYAADEFVWNNVEQWTDGQTYRTPDISDLIEDVLGTNGGASNAALGFRIEGEGSRVAHSFNSNGDAPELVIVFENDAIL